MFQNTLWPESSIFIQCTIAPYCLKSFWCHYHFHIWYNTSISCNITHRYVLMATNFPLSTTIANKLKCLSLQIFTCKFILLFHFENCMVIVAWLWCETFQTKFILQANNIGMLVVKIGMHIEKAIGHIENHDAIPNHTYFQCIRLIK